jgi:hypothetical protein
MKKLLTTTAIILSLNCAAQDTTYYQHRAKLYMAIRTQVTDSTVYKQHYSMQLRKQNRKNRIMTVIVGVVFSGISAWYWSR